VTAVEPEAASRPPGANDTGLATGAVAQPEKTLPATLARNVFYCDVSVSGPTAVLLLSGELFPDTVAELGAQLLAVIHSHHLELLVDMRALSRVSPTCVSALNRAAAELGRLGGRLTLTGVTENDRAALCDAGLSDAIWLAPAPQPRRPASTAGTA
jgi:anti-anti-sigma regulatory factor